MSSNQHKNFSAETFSLLAHMMNMTLNKAEQLSQRNQLPTENPRSYESSEMKDKNEVSSENASLSVPRINSSRGEAQPIASHDAAVDLFSADIATGQKYRTYCKPITIEISNECPSATFNYMMKARKDARDIQVPAKISVTQLREAGIYINFQLDTHLHPELPPLYICIFCPNYVPKQVWINGKECIH
ncbi:Uncharacterized protein BM_BM9970 [Brugia malayi]|uniref:Uncharacterized protein n=1 Tax=Brugia malayi TaxID=6279 RepID=A0A4E9FZH5_BRUMA|nr:Uncharacterized protein BM_BM9970 [Brugia malayi]VIO98434.1 Uncharacterized protein BM_BM9970 [Brugia malayi]